MSLLARFGVFLVAVGALVAIGPGPGSVAAATVPVAAGDFWFCNLSHQGNVCTTTINVGDTVQWSFTSTVIAHTSTSNTVGLWDSGKVPNGGTFSHTFTTPGSFMYHCTNHPVQMLGQIVVNAPSVGGIARLPDVANGSPAASPSSSGSGIGLIAGSAAIASGLIALAGAAWYARRRRVS